MRMLLALTGESVAPPGFKKVSAGDVRAIALQTTAFHQLPNRGNPKRGVSLEDALRWAFDRSVIDHFEQAVTPAPGDVEILGYHDPDSKTTLFFMRQH